MSKKANVWLSPPVLVPMLLAVVAVGYFGFQAARARSAAAAARAQLLEEVVAAAAKRPVDGDDLSRLAAQIQKYEDHATAPDLLAGLARIELARGRVQRAAELFGNVAGQPGASVAAQRLGALLCLRQYEQGASDRSTAEGLLRQAMDFAAVGYAASQDAADLTMRWLAASRLPDQELAGRLAAELQQSHASSPGAKLAKATADFRLDMPRADIEALREDFDVPPVEIDAMLALVVLQQGEIAASVKIVEPALQRMPGVLAIRLAAALVFHACVMRSEAGSADRADWVKRRDVQLDWLNQQAPPDDARRPQWASMRDVH